MVDMEPLQPLTPHQPLPKKERHVLPIVFVAAIIVFLLAVGAGAWVYIQRINNQVPATTLDTSETRNVTKVMWNAPGMPEVYTPTNQNTHDNEVAVYTNITAGCVLTSRVSPAEADTEKAVMKTLEAPGYGAPAISTENAHDFADVDDVHKYPFTVRTIDQSVSVPEVQMTSQAGTVYYKQFGQHIASLVLTCSSGGTQKTNLTELTTLAEQFTLKTERQ